MPPQGWTPSAIKSINDQDANQFVQNASVLSTYHDADARYNRMFPNQAQISMGMFVSEFSRGVRPTGPYTNVTYENGTTANYLNYARIQLNSFNGVTDGPSFFRKFCNLGPPMTPTKRDATRVERAQKSASATPSASPTGYPAPVVYHSQGVIGGYYLSGPGYDDVAVC